MDKPSKTVVKRMACQMGKTLEEVEGIYKQAWECTCGAVNAPGVIKCRCGRAHG
jgi:hypothetical protein